MNQFVKKKIQIRSGCPSFVLPSRLNPHQLGVDAVDLAPIDVDQVFAVVKDQAGDGDHVTRLHVQKPDGHTVLNDNVG